MAISDKFQKGSGSSRPVVTSLSIPKTAGSNTATISSASGWQTTTSIPVIIFRKDTNNLAVQGSQTDWTAQLVGNVLTGMVLRAGTEPVAGYPADVLTVVKCGPTAAWVDDLVDGITGHANQDGSLKTAAVQAALGLTNLNGYTPLGQIPNTIVYNGNRSYTETYNGVDLTAVNSNGMRFRHTRTVAAPTQCTSLNGTTQYYSKTAPAGMTFSTTGTAMAWIKPSSYATGGIISRFNNTNGWLFYVNASGQLLFGASNGGNSSTYQSIPLNKWVHVAAAYNAGTVQYYIDGVSVPSSGTATASITQAGNLEVGSFNASSFFSGKIAQAAVSSSTLTQAQIRSIYSQGITAADITAYNIVSAYSFNNSINDLNTTNANNLTANAGAVATNADSPFTQDANGVPSGTNDYSIQTSIAFTGGNTVRTLQVPEGCTIPTSGGVSAVVYSSNAKPFGFPEMGALSQVLVAVTQANFTVETDINGLVTTMDILSNRTYKISATLSFDVTTSDTTIAASIKLGSSYLVTRNFPSAASGYRYINLEFEGKLPAGTGSVIKIVAQRNSGTGTISPTAFSPSAGNPSLHTIKIESPYL